jgi:hypothetical protein
VHFDQGWYKEAVAITGLQESSRTMAEASETRTKATITTAPTASEDLLPPLQVWREYQAQHGVDSLKQEYGSRKRNSTTIPSSSTSRRFAVVMYTCPHRVGNFWNSAVHAIIWAVAHNRTILLRSMYVEESACRDIVRVPSWIPRYNVWNQQLGLPSPQPWNLTNQTANSIAIGDTNNALVAWVPQLPYISRNRKVVPKAAWGNDLLSDRFKAYVQSQTQLYNKDLEQSSHHSSNNNGNNKDATFTATSTRFLPSRVSALYALGSTFLDGMLLNEVFPFNPTRFNRKVLLPSTNNASTSADHAVVLDPETSSLFSVALHSRHVGIADDGSYVPNEIACLQTLLARSNYTSCRVTILADRDVAVAKLISWLRTHTSCVIVTAAHPEPSNSSLNERNPSAKVGSLDEHGTNAGHGFLDELALALSYPLDAVIGESLRSSFAILHKLAAYQHSFRHFPVLSRDATAIHNKLQLCELPFKHEYGYNYGPGTPTFRHTSRVKPLPQKQAWKEYLRQHSGNALEREWQSGRGSSAWESRVFAVVPFTVCSVDGSSLFHWMDSIRNALSRNQTLLLSLQPSNQDATSGGMPCATKLPENVARLRPHPELALYETWAPRLGLPVPLELAHSLTVDGTALKIDRFRFYKTIRNKNRPLLNSTDTQGWAVDPTSSTMDGKRANQTSGSNMEQVLLAEGTEYLYGMLFENSLLSESFTHTSTKVELAGFTVGLFAAHQEYSEALHRTSNGYGKQQTVDILREIDCLKRVLPPPPSPVLRTSATTLAPLACTVLAAADHPSILTALQDWLGVNRPDCRLRHSLPSFSSEDSRESWQESFPKDSDLLSQARNAWIQVVVEGNESQNATSAAQAAVVSSTLIRNRLELQRRDEAWKLGRVPMVLPSLETCVVLPLNAIVASS